jgi:uncharacterized protein (TIGR02118 family)
MATPKLVVIYPRPKDIDAFEGDYQKQYVPLAIERLGGKTKMVATKILGSPQGPSPFYRIAEVYFPTMEAVETCAASGGGKKRLEHAGKISSGGTPIFLIAEEESLLFTKTAGRDSS